MGILEYISGLDLEPYGYPSRASDRRTATTKVLERDQDQIARSLRRIETLKRTERRLNEEFEGPVSSKYQYPQDKKLEIEGFRKRLQAEVEDLINANVRKQAKPEIVGRNVSRTLRLLAAADYGLRGRKPPYYANSYKDVTNRFDATPRTVFGTEAWREHLSVWNARSSWKFSTRDFFKNASLVVPCVQRSVRRQVLHAKKYSGKGYRVRHRRGAFSDIWC